MKLTKREAEFLLVALQWAEEDRNTLADAHRVGPNYSLVAGGKQALRERDRVIKLRQKVRKWLHENGGKVMLTCNTRLQESDAVAVPITDIKEMTAEDWADRITERQKNCNHKIRYEQVNGVGAYAVCDKCGLGKESLELGKRIAENRRKDAANLKAAQDMIIGER